jgi:hypothetical protein
MSDAFIVIVPRDANCVLSPDVERRVTELLKRLAESAESVTSEVSEVVRFHDCGENFESVHCPRCAAEISIDWWQERMDDDADDEGFRLDAYATPCCGASTSLNELTYDWPQAFGRLSWTVQNPNIGELSSAAVAEIEGAAGVPVTVVRQHI